ncbi:MFS transporter [Companilactobacillus metriopterae]|uniref:MFS transporter n=1 Tax=Companilactobacillus metriopterae TaxID=1909267 RepID=UPI00100B8233|nr:MFS transporter [Companilactobacillus metriopterae]
MSNLSSNLKIRLSTSFMSRTIGSSIAPFMTLYFANIFGSYIAGILLAVQYILGYFFNILGGYLGDITEESQFLIFCLLSHGISLILLSITVMFNLNTIIMVLLFFISVSISNLYKATFNSLLISETTSENREVAFTIDYLSLNVSLAIGVILGSAFFINYSQYFFGISGLITLIIAYLLNNYFSFENSKKNLEYVNLRSVLKSYSVPLLDYTFVKFVIGFGMVSSVTLVLSNSLLIFIEKYNITLRFINLNLIGTNIFSVLQIENIVIVVAITPIAIKFFKNRYLKKTTLLGAFFLIITYSLTLLTFNKPYFLILLLLIGTIAELIFVPGAQSIQASLIPLERKSSYSAINLFSNNIAQGIASFGVSVVGLGFMVSFVYTFAFGLLGFFVLYVSIYKLHF